MRQTVWLQAATWRNEREKAAMDENFDAPPRPRTVEEIREAKVKQAAAFEEMLKKVGGG